MLRVKTPACYFLSVILLLSYYQIFAQTDNVPIPVLKANALTDFNEGRFNDALIKYESLLSRYPKDGVFHYYQGRCLLNLNMQFNKAASSLEYAASRTGVPVDALYYLGLVHMKSYRFTMAKNSFERFRQAASRQELRVFDVARQIQNAENAIKYTSDYNAYEIIASSIFSFTDSTNTRQVGSTGGRLVRKPAELMTPGENPDELTNLMFLPKAINIGDYVFISGYSRGKKGCADIFRVKYLNGKRWGTPEPVSSINTTYDEILPYFDPVGKDLYFASQGHSSMGGFDVFKSHYDESRDIWSEPVNLGFPVNSPFDELLFIPGASLGNILLITDRQSTDSTITAYRLQIKEPKIKLTSADPKELERIGNLEKTKPAIAQNDISVERTAEKPLVNPERKLKVGKELSTETRVPEMPAVYSDYLKKALEFQFKSDSLDRLAKESRRKAMEIPDPNERWTLQKKIIEWEKKSKDFQTEADVHYSKLKEMESAGVPAKSYPSTIKPDTVISGLTVYRYTEPSEVVSSGHSIEEAEKEDISEFPEMDNTVTNLNTGSVKQIEGEPGEQVIESKGKPVVSNRFVILEKSPYSAENPFPLDVPLPDGPFYQIQMGVFGQQISYENFGGVSPITGETLAGRNLIRYYAGKFSTYEEAVKSLEVLKKRGYQDAFIVAWYDGQKMPAAKVQELEKRH